MHEPPAVHLHQLPWESQNTGGTGMWLPREPLLAGQVADSFAHIHRQAAGLCIRAACCSRCIGSRAAAASAAALGLCAAFCCAVRCSRRGWACVRDGQAQPTHSNGIQASLQRPAIAASIEGQCNISSAPDAWTTLNSEMQTTTRARHPTWHLWLRKPARGAGMVTPPLTSCLHGWLAGTHHQGALSTAVLLQAVAAAGPAVTVRSSATGRESLRRARLASLAVVDWWACHQRPGWSTPPAANRKGSYLLNSQSAQLRHRLLTHLTCR